MTHSTSSDKYDIEIKSKEFRPSKENPEKVIVEIETELEANGKKKVFETHKVFRPEQVSSGRWERHVKQWVDSMHENMKRDESNYDISTGVKNVRKE